MPSADIAFLRAVWRITILALCCLALPARAAGEAPRGALVIIGGALRTDNAPVWQRIVTLAGGQGARIAVFGTASGNPARSALLHVERLRAYGADAFAVTGEATLADDVKGAFFVGGDQARITAALRNTPMLDSLWQLYRRGGVIAGTSAGAAIMSSTMIDNAAPLLENLRDGVRDGAGLGPGLGFIGDDVFVDQHLLVRGRFARMLPAMLVKGYKLGLGVDENSAIVVHPSREVEVIGYKGALLIDLAAASGTAAPLRVEGARISYLDSGDRFNLATRVFTPSADKADGLYKADPDEPRTPAFSADVLGQYAIVDLMTRLFTSGQTQAVGLAFGEPGKPQQGFEFRLTRDGRSQAYMSATSSAVSLFSVVLAVRPVRVNLTVSPERVRR